MNFYKLVENMVRKRIEFVLIDIEIQGHMKRSIFWEELSYFRLYSCYQKDLGVYFHII